MQTNILLKTLTVKYFYVIFFVTARCQARCNMCFYSNEIKNADKKKELTLSEIENIASHFRNLPYLSITGGEPTLRTDLAEIITIFYQKANTKNINISTNGLNPIEIEKVVRIVLDRCPRLWLKVSISLDALNENHDKIRNYKGAFKLAMESYKRLKKIQENTGKPLLYITTVLTQYNQPYVFEVIEFAKKQLNIDGHNICVVRGDTREPTSVPMPQFYEKVIKKITKNNPANLNNLLTRMMYQINLSFLQRDGSYIPCRAGKKMLVISETGSVRPCETLKAALPNVDDDMGNLRDFAFDINRLTSAIRAKSLIKIIKEKKCACTFECANMCSVIFNPFHIPKLLRKAWKNN